MNKLTNGLSQVRDLSLLPGQCFVNGEWIDSEKTIEVLNPASGEVIALVPLLGTADTRRAIAGASAAFEKWKKTSAKERSALLKKWFELVMASQEDLAVIMTSEQGKPLAESRGEIAYAASYIEWYAEEAKRVYGDLIPAPTADRRLMVMRQPVGVCAAITPWNFPAAMITRKVAPALAAGCAIVIKPASQTPLSALALCVLAERAGFPPGLISCVTGSASEIGAEMTGNPAVRKVSFTGSTEIGKVLLKQCADTVKKVSMELGGNAPFIVFDDADLDLAVLGVMVAKYRNSGQTCVCANRIFVQDSVYDAFTEKFAKAVSDLKMGSGLEMGTTIGPLIDANAVHKAQDHVNDALAKGAKVAFGGTSPGGNFFQPTILTDATPEMAIFSEETFSPVAPLFRFQTEEEVIRLANDSPYGLASYFYGRDINRIWRVAEALEFGMVGVNEGLISTEVAPFGGIKESGMGREGSKYGIDDYLEKKYVCIGGVS
jgi:succinate-semialdehyde dehydrogenase/glutarate-semialdehyde dehydrogenase